MHRSFALPRLSSPRASWGRFVSGRAPLDDWLGGGLARGCVHELFAGGGEDGEGDAASAAGFAAMLALIAQPRAKPLLWMCTEAAERRNGRLSAAGFAELGGDPADLVLALAPDDVALLRSAADALRCAGLGAVVIECLGNPKALDLTASRRLTLAAERSGATGLLLRLGARPAPSAAETRWAVRAAPSAALEANAPGHPALDIELLRRRAGPAGMRWRVEWDRDRRIFREPALSGPVLSPAFGGDGAGRLAAHG